MKLDSLKNRLASLGQQSISDVDYPSHGFCLEVSVTPDQLTAVVGAIDEEGFFIEAITGVDWLGENERMQKEAAAKAVAEAAASAGEGVTTAPAAAVAKPLAEDDIEVVYDFNCYDSFCRVTVRTRTPRNNAVVPTISHIYPGANWHERETHEFFGVKFAGHPYLVPLLLPEDADFHPLRKDFHQ